MSANGNISESSRRIARNTVLLYFRMGVMLIIGLFTYRVILRTLGITDYGVYTAVGGVLTMFTIVMNTVTSSISRYLTVGLGKGDPERLKTVFWTSVGILAGFCVLIAVLTETAGLWYLHHKMVIPPDRMEAAVLVLHTSLMLLVLNLVTMPYSAVITSHEHMDAYAWISILEGVLKLAVALGVWLSPADKLKTYAWLLLVVGVLVRGAYAAYARKHFHETHGPARMDPALVREMGAFAGWNFLGSGAYMVNTQGVNQLMNLFFGVGMNAARGVADKVEQVVRQFATNIALAINPQMTKSYVGGNRDYAYELACKGSKYYFWVLWVLAIPFLTDTETILRLWVGEVPQEAALFTRLTLLCFLVDFTPNTLITLEQAHGRIRRFYLITSALSVLAFPMTWVFYQHGAPAWTGYAFFLGFTLLKDAAMLWVVHQDTGLPVDVYFRKALCPIFWSILPAVLVVGLLVWLVPVTPWRFLLAAALGCLSTGAGIWLRGMTEGEKAYVLSKLRRK